MYIPWLSYIFILIVVGMVESTCNSDDSKSKTDLQRLKEDLFSNYDKTVRPVRLRTHSTVVGVEMIPLTLSFEEDQNIFMLDASIHLAWIDEFLGWNPSEYGGIRNIQVQGDSVWLPEIFHVSSHWWNDIRQGNKLCSLSWSGGLHCWDYHRLLALCRLDLTKWPYDSQNCSVTLSTILQSEEEIELSPMDVTDNLNEFTPNRIWKLLQAENSQYDQIFGNKVIPCVQYNFLLRRNDVISEVAVIDPLIVFVVLTLSSFWLDAEQDVRFNLCCTLFICHAFLLHEIGHMKNGDNAPLIGLFFRDSLVLTVLSLELTVLVQWLTTTAPRTVPHFINSILESEPARMLLMSGRSSRPKGSELLNEEKQESDDTETLPDSVIRWRLFGALINRLSFLVFCLVYLVLIIMYVV